MAQILGAGATLPIMLLCVGAQYPHPCHGEHRAAGRAVGGWQTGGLPGNDSGRRAVRAFVRRGAAGADLLRHGADRAASAYTLARQMGGDAPVMATIITAQTALSFVTLPLTVAAVQWGLDFFSR